MTRNEILAAYDVDSHGVIRSPGKFEAEPVYVPHFWELTLDGTAETLDWPDGATSYVIELDDSDRSEWPELPDDCVALHFEETDSGFVNCESLTASELEALREKLESEQEEESEECSDPCTAAERWHSGQWSGLYRFQCNGGAPDRDTAEDAISEAESILESHPDCDEAIGLQALIDECRSYLESHPDTEEEQDNDKG